MNWINHTTKLVSVLRSALVLGALLFFISIGRAESEETEDYVYEDGVLTVNKEFELDTAALEDLTEEGHLKAIIIEDGGKLVIEPGTMVYLEEGKITLRGTLEITSTLGTGIYSSKEPRDGDDISELRPDVRTTLTLDGNGVIRIVQGEDEFLMADTIDVVLRKSDENDYIGGTIFVDTDTTLQSGKVTGDGSVLKIGEGTLRVGEVNIGGSFTVREGTVHFLDFARINEHFILEQGTVHFHDTTRINGNFTLENGHAEFLGITTIVRNFVVEDGTATFHNVATISGNLIVGKAGKEADEENSAELSKEGTVEFFNTATISGILDVQEGSVHFHRNASVGVLRIADGMTVSGVPLMENVKKCKDDCEECEGECEIEETTKKHNLTITGANSKIEGTLKDIGTLAIARGGEITGTATLEGIDYLIVGGEILTIEGKNHTIEQIGIASGATLDIKDGAGIRLGLKETENTYDDLTIEGTLKISSAAIGIYKGHLDPDNLEHHLAPTHITVAGGTVEIYQGDDKAQTDLIANTLHTQVVGGGMIKVASGVTFESGDIQWSNRGNRRLTGAGVILSGGGTYRAGNVDLGTGYFVVQNEKDSKGDPTTSGTTMIFSQGVEAGVLFTEKETHVIAHGDALFQGAISIAGSYEGNGTNLTFLGNRQITENVFGAMTPTIITGNITGVDTLTVGGDLLLALQDDGPTISVNTWKFAPDTTTRIRTVAGSETGIYLNVIEIKGDDTDWGQLLDVLNSSQTALNRSKWSMNTGDVNAEEMGMASFSEESGMVLDLNLRILSVNEYIDEEWRMEGGNINDVGRMIEGFSRRSSGFRQNLEGLTDAQLQSTIRSALAGELAGNAFRIAMYQPAQPVFRHLDTVAPLRSPFGASRTHGQVREGFHVWFNPYGQTERGKDDGRTFDGYNLARYGFYLGGDLEIYNRAVFGTFFGYASPRVKSDLGTISANDYTAGLYLRIPTLWEMIVNMMIGFGSQDYTYKNSFSSTDFRGSSLFGSIELSRPLPLSNYLLTPIIALDFQSVMMDSFIARDPVLLGVLVEPEDISSAMLRIGLLGEMGRFRTRLQYMRQIAGEDVVWSQMTMLHDMATTTHVRGTQWGKDWLNVGVGAELLRTRHWRISADYNLDTGRRTTSHLGSFNTILTW